MPYKPKSPCSAPLCPELVESGERFCTKHKRVDNRNYDMSRDKKAKAFYNSTAWRRLRARKLKRDPLCQRCEKLDIVTAAQMVHHIVDINDGGNPLPPLDELESLCNPCHNVETPRGIIKEQAHD